MKMSIEAYQAVHVPVLRNSASLRRDVQMPHTSESFGKIIIDTGVTSTNGTSTQSCHSELLSNRASAGTILQAIPSWNVRPDWNIPGAILPGSKKGGKTAEILRRRRAVGSNVCGSAYD